jgi:DMATS type aromatic prenyltransferase
MEPLLTLPKRSRPALRSGLVPASPTLRSLGHKQIEGLCGALGIADQSGRALETFDILSNSWGDRTTDGPAFASDITDDHSPYEFSVAFDGRTPELRLLAEAQGQTGTTTDRWNAAWRMSEQLAQRCGASLSRARRVAPLFEPKVKGLTFAMWHAASLRAAQPNIRIYFNPLAKGRAHAMPSVLTALETLGMAGAAAWLKSRFAQGEHQPLYFSVDLCDGPTARCKVYLAHPAATAERIDSLIAGTGGHQRGDIREFCHSMTGSTGPWGKRPPLTCLAFREGCDLPYTVTFHIPIRCYARNDEVALERISSQLTSEEASMYERAIRGLARRPLDHSAGIQTYASVRREEGRKRMTIYLSPEAFSATPRSARD